jgi:hypothetical protein
MAIFISIFAEPLRGDTDSTIIPAQPSTAPIILSPAIDSGTKKQVFENNEETQLGITGAWLVTLTGTSCFQGTCWDIEPLEVVYNFTQSGKSFTGIVNFNDGTSSIFDGRLINETEVTGQ